MRVFSRISVLAFLVVLAVSMNAQWLSSGGTTTTGDKVGIGTTAPAAELHVVSQTATINLRGLVVDHYTNDGNAAMLTARKARGTLAAPLAVQNGDFLVNLFPMAYDGTQFINPSRIRFVVDGAVSAGSVPTAFQILTGSTLTGGTERVRVTSGGNVGIGTSTPAQRLHVVGNVRVDGELTGTNVRAHFQDLAEWVPSNVDLEPGTVVILDRAIGNAVMASSGAYDTTVAGVVSAQPGIILGEEGPSKEQVATTGRVRVKVDASTGSIQVGDLLVTSTKSGRAMKSSPVDIAGIAMHRPGTIIGKALEPLQNGEGEILVLLSMQ